MEEKLVPLGVNRFLLTIGRAWQVALHPLCHALLKIQLKKTMSKHHSLLASYPGSAMVLALRDALSELRALANLTKFCGVIVKRNRRQKSGAHLRWRPYDSACGYKV